MKLFVFLAALVALGVGSYFKGDWLLSALDVRVHGPYTVDQRLSEYAGSVAARLKPDFAKAGVVYPPQKITLVVLKHERQVQLYAQAPGGDYTYVRTYPILAASGHLGPKRRQGDDQVPEGIYGVDSLNPNSHYHLALHVDYPNAFDRAMAKADGRTDLGGDIMIHGSHVSIGCSRSAMRAPRTSSSSRRKSGWPMFGCCFARTTFGWPGTCRMVPICPAGFRSFMIRLSVPSRLCQCLPPIHENFHPH